LNLLLSMVVISAVCFGICVWLTPALLRRIAAQLLTRADVIDASKAEHRRRIQFWCGELGVAHDLLASESTIADPAASPVAQN